MKNIFKHIFGIILLVIASFMFKFALPDLTFWQHIALFVAVAIIAQVNHMFNSEDE